MAYEDDIFISYAHIDNQSVFDDDPGWISAFHRHLERRVAQLLGYEPKIWRDPALQGNDVFPETLAQRIKKAAALVCVLSPRYVQSDWCRRELDTFTETDWKLAVDDTTKARVFKVVKTPLPHEKFPEKIKDLLGYNFFKEDPETKQVRELDVSIPDPEIKKHYRYMLDDLARQIQSLLEVVKEGSAAAGDYKGTVYLAETSGDLREEHDAIRRDLERHRYRVLPDVTLPDDAAELEEVVREQVSRATLSVHLMGASFGVVPDGTTASKIAIQNEAAADRAAEGGLERLVWIKPGVTPDDQRQQAFLDALRDDERTYVKSDLLEVPLEDLKTQIHHKLEPVEETPEPPAAADGGPPKVYLICDQRDLEGEGLPAVYNHLLDLGLDVVVPAFDDDEARMLQDHVAKLTASDAFFFYYGAGSGSWIRNQMRELEKSRGYPGKRPERAIAIYLAAPLVPEKQLFRPRLTQTVIRERAGFQPDDLAPFLKELEGVRASGPV